MADKSHTVNAHWREADAAALEQRVVAINDWLDHTEDLAEMLKHEEEFVTELRRMTGKMRSRRDDFSSEAAGLKAELSDAK